jgi:hypothetical protein
VPTIHVAKFASLTVILLLYAKIAMTGQILQHIWLKPSKVLVLQPPALLHLIGTLILVPLLT